MKYYSWNNEKNARLLAERGISFEMVVFCIERGQLLDIVEHFNPKYEGQRIFIVEIDNYVYLVPFVEMEDAVFLKTIIPSRKATRKVTTQPGNHGGTKSSSFGTTKAQRHREF